MKVKSIGISSRVLSRFPDVSMGYLIAENICNLQSSELDKKNESRLHALSNLQLLEQCNGINKWREIYAKMNAKKGRISSVESLISMYLQNKKLPNINPFVNYYNILSCFLGVPMGAYTIDNLPTGNIELREANKNEEFVPIGAKSVEKTSNGEVVYGDSSVVICKSWNYRDADISKITESSKNILLIFDGADDEQKTMIKEGLRITQEEIPIYFKASIKSFGILDISQNKLEF